MLQFESIRNCDEYCARMCTARARMLCTSSQSVNVEMMPMSARSFPVYQHTKVGREHQQESAESCRVSHCKALLILVISCALLCFACEHQLLSRSFQLRFFTCHKVSADSLDMSRSNFLIYIDPNCGLKRCETTGKTQGFHEFSNCKIDLNKISKKFSDFAGVLRSGAGAAELLLDGDLTKPSGLDGGGSRKFPGAEPWEIHLCWRCWRYFSWQLTDILYNLYCDISDKYIGFTFWLGCGHWWCLWHFLTQESECESRDGGWTALAKGPADDHTGHYFGPLLPVLPCHIFPVLHTAFTSPRVWMLAVRGLLFLHNPPLESIRKARAEILSTQIQ